MALSDDDKEEIKTIIQEEIYRLVVRSVIAQRFENETEDEAMTRKVLTRIRSALDRRPVRRILKTLT